MKFKPDWEQAKERFQAFWEGGIVDRCCLAVTAPRHAGVWDEYERRFGIDRFADDDHASIRSWWCDPEENVRRAEFLFGNTFYGGEALPIAFTNWGAMVQCAFYGCEPVFNKNSVWYHKTIQDWDSWEFRIDRSPGSYWDVTRAITAAFAASAKDRFFAGVPEIGSAGDVLSLLRSMDSLCLDFYDEPDRMHAVIDTVTTDFLALQDEFFAIVAGTGQGGGVLPWMSLWMPGRHGNQLACDLSWVLSNAMFREFFGDELRREAAWTDFATYHLDGPMCLENHLESLLEMDGIKAIEWTPGAGSPPTTHPAYFAHYRRIQEKGKRLVLLAEPEEVEPLLEALKPEGLFLKVQARTEEEARWLLKLAERKALRGR
jgi:hypothetical protein